MRNALTALSLGIALEQLAHLKEQHDEDRLRELRLGSWQESDAEGSDGGNGHEEMLIEGITMQHTFGCLLQRFVAYQQIRNQIYQQQLPRGQCHIFLNDDSGYQQRDSHKKQYQFSLHAPLFVMVVLVMMFV